MDEEGGGRGGEIAGESEESVMAYEGDDEDGGMRSVLGVLIE